MAEYIPCTKADPTARAAIESTDKGFRTVQIMNAKAVLKHRERTRVWQAHHEEELRLAAEKKRKKMLRQNTELQLRGNAILRMGMKLKEFQRYLLVNYDGQIKDSEMREIERLAENAGALFMRYEKLISVIVERNMEKGERVRR